MLDKVWDDHVVRSAPGEPDLLYVDMHLIHEVTSPQAFESLALSGRRVRRPDLSMATVDHGIPTVGRELGISDPLSKRQIGALEQNCEEHGITLFGVDDVRQGIVHLRSVTVVQEPVRSEGLIDRGERCAGRGAASGAGDTAYSVDHDPGRFDEAVGQQRG